MKDWNKELRIFCALIILGFCFSSATVMAASLSRATSIQRYFLGVGFFTENMNMYSSDSAEAKVIDLRTNHFCQ